ncbi:hypothetical protein [Cryobacterium sp. TMT4-31]|uniref:hypothetical protein n=1 Tax=Cryobacterium sp. TMT4-31 TaxID=1259259 RepID=UPI00106C548D|nr:hypothetical protein [Cryobacterium sp. TMT4-31]TFC84880.1 hypothetical protein E3T19_18110 [Cryobacterium sp. TMT4-31]
MNSRASVVYRQGTIAALAVGVLLVAGCAGESAGEQPAGEKPAAGAASTAPTETPVPSATPAPAEPNLDDPSSWLIDYTAIGPLTLHGQLADQAASTTAFTTTVQDGCPWVTALDKADFPSIWLPDPAGTGVTDQIVLQAWGSEATVAANSPQTSAGIGIGATLDQVTAAYPDIEQNDGTYAPYYSLPDGSGHWINFALSSAGLVDTIVVRDTALMDSEYCG